MRTRSTDAQPATQSRLEPRYSQYAPDARMGYTCSETGLSPLVSLFSTRIASLIANLLIPLTQRHKMEPVTVRLK